MSKNNSMNWYKKIAQTAAGQLIQGPAVDALIQTTVAMDSVCDGGRCRDDMGFQGGIKNDPTVRLIAATPQGQPVNVQDAVRMVQILQTYKNTQVPQWQQIKDSIQQAIAATTPQPTAQPQPNQPGQLPGDKIVRFLGAGGYGRQLFSIPNFNLKRKMNAAVRAKMEDLGMQPEPDNYSGQLKQPAWKMFSAQKGEFDQFLIHPKVTDTAADILEADGYNVDALRQIETQVQQQQVAAKVLHAKQVDQGGINLRWEYDAAMLALFKTVAPYSQYSKADHSRTIFDMKPEQLKAVSDAFKSKDYDTSQLDQLIDVAKAEQPTQPAQTQQSQGEPLQVADISAGGHFQVSIRSGRNREANAQLKEALRYIFPAYGEDGMRNYNRNSYQWELKGKNSQYHQLTEVAERLGFDTNQMRSLLRDMLREKKIDSDKTPGVLDGYAKYGDDGRIENDVIKFDQELDASSKIKLYDKQKDGVRFLYSRASAVMGDETGAGKTFQMVAAANMRMNQTGGRALIITLGATQLQWEQEIAKFTGDVPATISKNPNDQAKWTVLYYDMFSNGNAAKDDRGIPLTISKRDKLVDDIIAQNFQVLILDECHNVKTVKSIRSANISKIAESIPYKWGASATFIANKPMDGYNQLKVLGHPLGDVSSGRWKKDFGGMVPGGYGGAYVDGTKEQQQEAAGQMRKWLTQTGAYIKRTKQDMRPGMPSHTISDVPIEIDSKKLASRVRKRMNTYKDPDLAISQMIAERTELATMKVPQSLDMAKNVLVQGKKVIVFTCFKESAAQLIAGLTKTVNSREVGGGQVEHVTGNDGREDIMAAVTRFKQDGSDSKALVLSILKGGTGLDIPNVVDDVIINDFSWTPKDAEQSEGRAFRISSDNDVETKYVVATNSPDADYYEYVQGKKALAHLIQNLEQKESELVLKGLDTRALLEQRKKLETRSLALDKNLRQKGLRTDFGK